MNDIEPDEKQKAKARLEELIVQGLESGEPVEVTPGWWTDLWDEVARDSKARGR